MITTSSASCFNLKMFFDLTSKLGGDIAPKDVRHVKSYQSTIVSVTKINKRKKKLSSLSMDGLSSLIELPDESSLRNDKDPSLAPVKMKSD